MLDRTAVRVELRKDAYDIIVESGLLQELGSLLTAVIRCKKAAVISDSNVAPLYLDYVKQSLAIANVETIDCTIPPGESHKTLNELLPVFDRLLASRFDRKTPVVALGGGIIGDMAGFVAATILRGVPFFQIPTTLLAMVDASVGGKTGVNHAMGKNLIGAFHQPRAVFIDPLVLRTLPARELRGGLAECIKHDLIRDADGFAALESNIHRAIELDVDYLSALIAHNVAIKARVVEKDPHEHGERAHLNLGHTFGHAIESVSNYEYSHGESVSLGIAAAAQVSEHLGLIDQNQRTRILSVLSKVALPVTGLTLSTQAIVDAMGFDKKVEAGRIRLVLLDRIGHAVVRDDVPAEMIARAIESLR